MNTEHDATIEILNEWVHDYITPHEDKDYNIDDESKEILLHLKSSNNTSIRIIYNGDSGTRACVCCDGYVESYYHIFVDDKLLYEATILLADEEFELTITHHVVQN